ncbi:MAG: hypothetical protein WCL05_07250 [Verrucomicrobiota bacterium]
MIRALRQRVVTWGALVLPLFVYAHNGEFLLAKLTLRTDGECVLRVTVDTEANFNIQDRAQLAKAAENLFQLSAGKETTALRKVAGEPSFSSESKLDPAAPLGHTAEEIAKSYKLEVVEWTWTPESPKFVLRLPELSPHTVVLWLNDETKPVAKPRWVMMIAEDESPLITAVPPLPESLKRRIMVQKVGLSIWLLTLVIGVGLHLKRRRQRLRSQT